MQIIRKIPDCLFAIILILSFTGSVFFTSGKFVNVTNSPKYYFVLLAFLCSALFFSIGGEKLKLNSLNNVKLQWAVYLVCLAQAVYGLLQSSGYLPSNHRHFTITGSFDNPAGFAAVLAAGFPLGLWLLLIVKGWKRYLVIASQLIMALAIILSDSRAGVLAIVAAGFVFLVLTFRSRLSIVLHHQNWFLLPVLVLLLAGTSFLYHQKKDSANGRLLIWQVSWEMLKDKPLFGHGYGAFQAKYMDYQAEYFRENQDSEYSLLADNVKHPFNEFLKVAVEFGLAGLLLVLVFTAWLIYIGIKSKNDLNPLIFSGLTALLVFACFSYPFQYIANWLILAFYLSALLSPKEFKIGYSKAIWALRVSLAGVSVLGIFMVYQQIGNEIKWKTIAINSLKGQTEKMLPEYEKLHSTSLKQNPYFLYNYGAELIFSGKYTQSIAVLNECQKQFNDYDLQMLLADNYEQIGETKLALRLYRHASDMVPCRFLPLYRMFRIYQKEGDMEKAGAYAEIIVNKQVKVPSLTIKSIKTEAQNFLKDNL